MARSMVVEGWVVLFCVMHIEITTEINWFVQGRKDIIKRGCQTQDFGFWFRCLSWGCHNCYTEPCSYCMGYGFADPSPGALEGKQDQYFLLYIQWKLCAGDILANTSKQPNNPNFQIYAVRNPIMRQRSALGVFLSVTFLASVLERPRSFLRWLSQRSLPPFCLRTRHSYRETNPALSCVELIPTQVQASCLWVVETRIWSILYGQIYHWNCCARTACPTDGCSSPKGLSADSQTTSPSCSLTLLPLVAASLGAHRIISLPFSNSARFLPQLSLTG